MYFPLITCVKKFDVKYILSFSWEIHFFRTEYSWVFVSMTMNILLNLRNSLVIYIYYRHQWWLLLCMLRSGKLDCLMSVTKIYYVYGHLYLNNNFGTKNTHSFTNKMFLRFYKLLMTDCDISRHVLSFLTNIYYKTQIQRIKQWP